MRLYTLCVNLALMLFVLPALQSGQQPIDGASAVLADPLLDKMVGHWTVDPLRTPLRPNGFSTTSSLKFTSGDLQTPRDWQAAIRSVAHNRL